MQKRLTDAIIRNAKAKAGERYYIRDTDTPGLSVRVSGKGTPDGRVTVRCVWRFAYRRKADSKLRNVAVEIAEQVDGVDRTRTGYPAVSLSEARQQARYLRTLVDAGRDPAGEKIEARAEPTVAEYVETYLIERAQEPKPPRTLKRQGHLLRKHLVAALGWRRLSEVTRAQIREEVIKPIKASGAPIQANRVFEHIRTFFAHALSETEYLNFNPCDGLRKPSEERSRERILAPAEIVTFWTGLDGANMHERTRLVLRLCLVTGQRVSEVAGAAKGELDLDAAVWDLPGARTKNGRPHRVPLSPMAVDLFRAALALSPDGSAFVFPGAHRRVKNDRPMTGHSVAKALNRNILHPDAKPENETSTPANRANPANRADDAAEPKPPAIELENVTPHDLRRTCASGMGELGFSRLIQDKVLNHATADRGISGTYDRFEYQNEKRHALEAWAERLQEILTGAKPASNVVTLRAAPGASEAGG